MILSRVRDYLKQHRRASVADLAHGLEATPDAVRAMLEVLRRKGLARRVSAGTACGNGCRKCDSASLEIYEWAQD